MGGPGEMARKKAEERAENNKPQSPHTRKTRVYIAGPMRGHPHFNFPAFFAAEARLKDLGFEPFNPAAADNEAYGADVSADNPEGDEELAAVQFGLTLREALHRDTAWITQKADAIYMLKGWEASSGARAEWALANALGLDIYYEYKAYGPLTTINTGDTNDA